MHGNTCVVVGLSRNGSPVTALQLGARAHEELAAVERLRVRRRPRRLDALHRCGHDLSLDGARRGLVLVPHRVVDGGGQLGLRKKELPWVAQDDDVGLEPQRAPRDAQGVDEQGPFGPIQSDVLRAAIVRWKAWVGEAHRLIALADDALAVGVGEAVAHGDEA